MTVRSGKINVFKHTTCFFFFWETTALVRDDACLRRDADDLTRLHITDKLCADRMKSAGLGCQNVGVISLTNTERSESVRISGSDQLSWRHNDQRISSLDLIHGSCNCFFCGFCIHTLSGNMIGNDLRINGRLENCSAVLQFMPKLWCIDQITIVGNCQSTFNIIKDQRLCILSGAASCRGITGMSHCNITMHSFQNLRGKYFIDQSHTLVGRHFTRSIRISYCDSAALLPTVLQCQQSIIYG